MESLLGILAVQIALTLLVPGMLFHGRTMFLCDLWVVMCIPILGFLLLTSERRLSEQTRDLPRFRQLFAPLAGVAFLFALSFIHGRYRTSISDELMRRGIGVQESDRFNGIHEIVIAIRFLSWIVEGTLIAQLVREMDSSQQTAFKRKLTWVLLGFGGLAAIVSIASGLSGSFTEWLGGIYGFAGDLPTYRGRGIGPFRTPLETGLTLSLCLLLLLCASDPGSPRTRNRARSVLAVFGAAVVLSRTLTAVAALAITWGSTRFSKLRTKTKVFLVSAVIACVGLLVFAERGLVDTKIDDFTYRFTPWAILLEAMGRHPGSILLGTGFAPVNVDNAYLFVLVRLGCLGFAALVFLAIRWGKANWKHWSLAQREVLIFLLITGLTLDTFILRPVVMIFIAAGLPLLATSSASVPVPSRERHAAEAAR